MEHTISKRIPINLIEQIKKGRTKNMLRTKQSGKYSQQIENNIGVSQGSPISAILFIIYDDYVMKNTMNK